MADPEFCGGVHSVPNNLATFFLLFSEISNVKLSLLSLLLPPEASKKCKKFLFAPDVTQAGG
jgi:hypothetical protein